MLSGNLWPAHPHPQQGESLSCWIVRIAHANGLKAQTFCQREFGKEFQIWNRDIDRNTPEWLREQISQKSGVSQKVVNNSTAKLYERRLFPTLHTSSQLRWFMPIKSYHRLHRGYALQYCPKCLQEDPIPYYRLAWRLALYTFCPKHQILMADRCPHCQAPIEFHRIELGKHNIIEVETLDCCWQCGETLSDTLTQTVDLHPKLVDSKWNGILRSIDRQFYPAGGLNYSNLTLLHQLCRLLSSPKTRPNLASHICNKGGYPQPTLNQPKLIFEQRPISERHELLTLAWWVMTNRRKLRELIAKRAVRKNWLYKDMAENDKQIVARLLSPVKSSSQEKPCHEELQESHG